VLERASLGATPIHASIAAAKIINTAATRYPMNNAVLDPVPMIQPNSSGAPTPPTRVPTARKLQSPFREFPRKNLAHGQVGGTGGR